MDNVFSTQFKNNRKKKGLSQEQIADLFCVSPQAVSKWETGASYPDLSLLPIIANFFGVSVDCLLGINLSEREDAIRSILKECQELTEQEQYCDAVSVLRKALVKYPSEPRLMYQLAWDLTGTIRVSSENWENLYEAIELYKKILQLTDDQELYNKSLRDLIYRYYTANDVDAARKIADRLVPFEFCREYNLGRSNLLDGRELAEYLMSNIRLYGEAMKECLEYFVCAKILTDEQKKPLTADSAQKAIYGIDEIIQML